MAALVISLLAFLAAAAVASSQETMAERVVASAPAMKRWGGVLLILVGIYFIVTGLFAESFARLFPV